MATMETRGEKLEEFHKHLKYREHILEFAGPKMNVTEEAAAEEPPNYSKVFDLEKVKGLKEKCSTRAPMKALEATQVCLST